MGTKCGRHIFPGQNKEGKKTIEGTCAAFISIMLSVMCLLYIRRSSSSESSISIFFNLNQLMSIASGSLLIALMETYTEHIDNIVLPIYSVIGFLLFS